MATFHLDSADVQMLDMRSPGQPVAELRAHQGEVNAIGWGKSDSHLLSTSGKIHFYALNTFKIHAPFPRIGRSIACLGPLTFKPLIQKCWPVEELAFGAKGQQKHHHRSNPRLHCPRRAVQSRLVAAYACLLSYGRPCAGRRLDSNCDWKVAAMLEGVGKFARSVSGGRHVEYLGGLGWYGFGDVYSLCRIYNGSDAAC